MHKQLVVGLWLATGLLFASAAHADLVRSFEKPEGLHEITASDHYKFVWLRIPKSGSRSLAALLRTHMGSALNHDPEATHWSEYDAERYADYFKVIFVRNPWDRIVSAYFNKAIENRGPYLAQCREMSFDEFVDWLSEQDLSQTDVHVQRQLQYLPEGVEPDFVGRLEEFAQDATALLAHFGFEVGDIPHRNSSKHAHYSHYYTERTKEIVRRLYEEDIAAFGYEFEYKDASQ